MCVLVGLERHDTIITFLNAIRDTRFGTFVVCIDLYTQSMSLERPASFPLLIAVELVRKHRVVQQHRIELLRTTTQRSPEVITGKLAADCAAVEIYACMEPGLRVDGRDMPRRVDVRRIDFAHG